MGDSMDKDEAERFLRHAYPEGQELRHCFSRDAAFVNHSCNPTCAPDTMPITQSTKWVATRHLDAGEEVTHDYSAFGQYASPPEWYVALFARIGIEFPSIEMMNAGDKR